jgi:hypothetical protein
MAPLSIGAKLSPVAQVRSRTLRKSLSHAGSAIGQRSSQTSIYGKSDRRGKNPGPAGGGACDLAMTSRRQISVNRFAGRPLQAVAEPPDMAQSQSRSPA